MSMGDTYPGDQAYWSEVKRIHQSVSTDEIRLGKRTDGFGKEFKKPDLATELAKAHNSRAIENQEPNAAWTGARVTEGDVEHGLARPTPYGSSDWEAWMGFHRGYWYTPEQNGQDERKGAEGDDAGWFPPRTTQRSEFSDPDDHQDVYFYTPSEEVKRVGWNGSNAAVDYVWGWDPKDVDPSNFGGGPGSLGTHVGYPFVTDDARWIVWVTPQVAFLECITPRSSESNRRRSSVPSWNWGYGQWEVTNWKYGVCTAYP